MDKVGEKCFVILRKLAVALVIALFLALLGIFGGLGYHVHYIEELSFIRHYSLGYADATFSCDIIYNPILYPFYWMVGGQRISGTFSTIYTAEAYSGGEFGHAIWPPDPRERCQEYILQMVTWGTSSNLLVLLSFTVAIEIIGRRTLYLLFFCGTFGFFIAELLGTIIGLATGAFLALRMNDFFVQLWHDFWK